MLETGGGLLVSHVDHTTCTHCGLCLKVCPGFHIQEGLIPKDVDPFKGNVLAAYIGQAVDKGCVREAQSGGVVTAILQHAIKSGHSKQALVTEMPEDGSLRPRGVLTSDMRHIRGAAGSKYCPVALHEVLTPDVIRDERGIAMVGLPCHIHGLRNAQWHLERWRECVTLTIGLFCEHVLAFGAMGYLVDQGNVPRGEVSSYRFKSKKWNGWPGDGCILTTKGDDRCVPNIHRLHCKQAFCPAYCRLCFDRLNVLSDLSAGDAWGVQEDREGVTVIMARTDRGLDILDSAVQAGVISVTPISPDAVFKGQLLETRRQQWTALTTAWRKRGGVVPDFGVDETWHCTLPAGNLKHYSRLLNWANYFASLSSESQVIRAAKWKLLVDSVRASLGRILSPHTLAKRLFYRMRNLTRTAWIRITRGRDPSDGI